MRVDKPQSSSGTSASKRMHKASGTNTNFSTLLDGDVEGLAAPKAPFSVMGVEALCALQGPGEEATRRHAVRYGQDMVNDLEVLRDCMLRGTLTPAQVETLATKVALQRNTTNDSRLEALLADIDLRARVELAKLKTRPAQAQV